MTTQILAGDRRVLTWVAKRLGTDDIGDPQEFEPCVAYGVLINGKPVAGVVFNWYRKMRFGNDIRVTIAASNPSWCQREVLRHLFDYPFNRAGCTRLTAIIKEGNKRSLKLCQGLGFKKEGVLRRAYNGKSNAIILSMLPEECKWIRDNGQKVERHAARSKSGLDDRSAERRE